MARIILVCLLLAAVAGCSSVKAFYDSPHPGMYNVGGAEIQLFYSNPDAQYYNVPNSQLPMTGLEVPRIFEKRGSYPTVTGGIGIMSTWRF